MTSALPMNYSIRKNTSTQEKEGKKYEIGFQMTWHDLYTLLGFLDEPITVELAKTKIYVLRHFTNKQKLVKMAR